MEEIEVVIKIDKDIYEARQHWVANPKRMMDKVDIAIANGTPLPKGHGDLKDIDAINLYQEDFYDGSDYVRAIDAIIDAPTIIEADKGGEE